MSTPLVKLISSSSGKASISSPRIFSRSRSDSSGHKRQVTSRNLGARRVDGFLQMAVCQNLVPLVNIKIAGKWMFIPLKMVLIGIDPYPDV